MAKHKDFKTQTFEDQSNAEQRKALKDQVTALYKPLREWHAKKPFGLYDRVFGSVRSEWYRGYTPKLDTLLLEANLGRCIGRSAELIYKFLEEQVNLLTQFPIPESYTSYQQRTQGSAKSVTQRIAADNAYIESVLGPFARLAESSKDSDRGPRWMVRTFSAMNERDIKGRQNLADDNRLVFDVCTNAAYQELEALFKGCQGVTCQPKSYTNYDIPFVGKITIDFGSKETPEGQAADIGEVTDRLRQYMIQQVREHSLGQLPQICKSFQDLLQDVERFADPSVSSQCDVGARAFAVKSKENIQRLQEAIDNYCSEGRGRG